MRKTVVINVVGLTPGLLGDATPRLQAFAEQGRLVTVDPVVPAVTCSVQATYLTGAYPSEHGIVGNGWYDRQTGDVRFWQQSNRLIERPKIWELARAFDEGFTCANLCWWFNMYSSVDYAITPRPLYLADGREVPDVYTQPMELRDAVQSELGTFPLFKFWGPATSIRSSRWIADAAMWVDSRSDPTLTLVYLPHLDYNLQRLGPNGEIVASDLRAIDAVCGDLIAYYEARNAQVVLLSEYGIGPVSRPVHLNRILREHGLLAIREEQGREMLFPGSSPAVAVPDHQVAHVYVNDPACLSQVRELLEATEGVARVLDEQGKQAVHLDHPRSGDLVAIAEPDAWFTYYYWLDDDRAPDFARTVDIHRKPGYDPVELFLDPEIRLPLAKVGLTVLKKQLGFRYRMDVVPLDPSLVRGSHGRIPESPSEMPVLMTKQTDLLGGSRLRATEVCDLILRHLRGGNGE